MLKTLLFNGALTALMVLGVAFQFDSCSQKTPSGPPDAGVTALLEALERRIELLESKPEPSGVGRYHLDRPSPPWGHSPLLLDTVTGDAWLQCVDGGADGKSTVPAWCLMHRGEFLYKRDGKPPFDPDKYLESKGVKPPRR